MSKPARKKAEGAKAGGTKRRKRVVKGSDAELAIREVAEKVLAERAKHPEKKTLPNGFVQNLLPGLNADSRTDGVTFSTVDVTNKAAAIKKEMEENAAYATLAKDKKHSDNDTTSMVEGQNHVLTTKDGMAFWDQRNVNTTPEKLTVFHERLPWTKHHHDMVELRRSRSLTAAADYSATATSVSYAAMPNDSLKLLSGNTKELSSAKAAATISVMLQKCKAALDEANKVKVAFDASKDDATGRTNRDLRSKLVVATLKVVGTLGELGLDDQGTQALVQRLKIVDGQSLVFHEELDLKSGCGYLGTLAVKYGERYRQPDVCKETLSRNKALYTACINTIAKEKVDDLLEDLSVSVGTHKAAPIAEGTKLLLAEIMDKKNSIYALRAKNAVKSRQGSLRRNKDAKERSASWTREATGKKNGAGAEKMLTGDTLREYKVKVAKWKDVYAFCEFA